MGDVPMNGVLAEMQKKRLGKDKRRSMDPKLFASVKNNKNLLGPNPIASSPHISTNNRRSSLTKGKPTKKPPPTPPKKEAKRDSTGSVDNHNHNLQQMPPKVDNRTPPRKPPPVPPKKEAKRTGPPDRSKIQGFNGNPGWTKRNPDIVARGPSARHFAKDLDSDKFQSGYTPRSNPVLPTPPHRSPKAGKRMVHTNSFDNRRAGTHTIDLSSYRSGGDPRKRKNNSDIVRGGKIRATITAERSVLRERKQTVIALESMLQKKTQIFHPEENSPPTSTTSVSAPSSPMSEISRSVPVDGVSTSVGKKSKLKLKKKRIRGDGTSANGFATLKRGLFKRHEETPAPSISVTTVAVHTSAHSEENTSGERSPGVQTIAVHTSAHVGGPSGGNGNQPKAKPKTPFERRTKIANEILDTERTYVKEVNAFLDVYKPALDALANRSDNNIKPGQVKTIFGSLQQIIPVNEEVLRRLEDRLYEWDANSTIGDIFIAMAPFMKIYTEYGNGYEASLTMYTQLMKDPVFSAVIDSCDSQVSTRLEGCLIMPVQRLPRYTMFLEDLHSRTEDHHPDKQLLKSALGAVQGVTQAIDENIKETEQRMQFLALSNKPGYQALVAPHRKLLKHGMVQEARGKKFLLILFNDILVPVFASSKLKTPSIAQAPQWPLNLVWIKDHADVVQKNYLEIIGPCKRFILKMNEEDEGAWRTELTKAISRHFDNGETPPYHQPRTGSFTFKNRVEYKGDWLIGQMHGAGKSMNRGNYFVGKFYDNTKSGTGAMTFCSEDVYTGNWEKDLPNGKGNLQTLGYEYYEGEWKDGMRHGKGALTLPNGDYYDGNWLENLPHGKGKLVCTNGFFYTGEWMDGLFHGTGHCSANGKEYTGKWANGYMHGNGVFKQYCYESDKHLVCKYDGPWVEGLREGVGILTTEYGTYVGEFADDQIAGKGKMEYADGSAFDGAWKRGRWHGFGSFTGADHSNISKYVGEFYKGLRQGRGALYYKNGTKYEGQFKRDVPHGNGVLTLVNGCKYDGKFARGNRTGAGKFYWKDNNKEGTDGALEEFSASVPGTDAVFQAKNVSYLLAPPPVSFTLPCIFRSD